MDHVYVLMWHSIEGSGTFGGVYRTEEAALAVATEGWPRGSLVVSRGPDGSLWIHADDAVVDGDVLDWTTIERVEVKG